jgi:hypothetical protein
MKRVFSIELMVHASIARGVCMRTLRFAAARVVEGSNSAR